MDSLSKLFHQNHILIGTAIRIMYVCMYRSVVFMAVLVVLISNLV